jgi:hypothetical protein
VVAAGGFEKFSTSPIHGGYFYGKRERRQTESRLSLATLITLAESAIMPCPVVGVGCAEPPPADLAVICSRGVAWFIHRRYRLAGVNDVSGFCLILLLQIAAPPKRFYARFSDVVGGPSARASTNLSDNRTNQDLHQRDVRISSSIGDYRCRFDNSFSVV